MIELKASDSEYMTGTVECVNGSGGGFTKGKIYEVEDGIIMFNDTAGDNQVKHCFNRIRSVTDMNSMFVSKFKEV